MFIFQAGLPELGAVEYKILGAPGMAAKMHMKVGSQGIVPLKPLQGNLLADPGGDLVDSFHPQGIGAGPRGAGLG